MNLDTLRGTLEQMGRDVAQNYKDGLIAHDHFTTMRSLLDSIRTEVKVDGSVYEVTMTLNHYWKYVEEGVRGDRNPDSPYANPGWKAYPHIARWIEIKPVIPRPDARGRIPSPKSLTYLITRSIVQHGTRGTHDLANAKEVTLAFYREKIEAALRHDMYDYITKVMRS